MRIPILAVPALLLIAAAPPPAPRQPLDPAVTRDCIDLRQIRESKMGPGTYDVRVGRDWWRNTAECPALGSNRAIVTSTPAGRLCRGDIATIVEPQLGFSYGGCGLGNWTKLAPVAAAASGR